MGVELGMDSTIGAGMRGLSNFSDAGVGNSYLTLDTRSSSSYNYNNRSNTLNNRGHNNRKQRENATRMAHHASTPHLFVYKAQDDDDEDLKNRSDNTQQLAQSQKEPIYQSAVDIRKVAAAQEERAVRKMQERYDSLSNLRRQSSSMVDDPLAVTEDDMVRIETFFRGNKTQIWVCETMANVYSDERGKGGGWQLLYTGVPVLLLDQGLTKSRTDRKLQIILAEKGTGFSLWRDVVDNLTAYKVVEPHFHTMFLSSDHSKRFGLSFNDSNAAIEFHGQLERLTSDPANISLSAPGKNRKKNKEVKKPVKYKPPRKTDISQPCNFQHVTTVDSSDKETGRFFSLKAFSRILDPPKPHTVIERPGSVSTEDDASTTSGSTSHSSESSQTITQV